MNEENKLNLKINTTEKDVLDLFVELPQEIKFRILEIYSYDEIIGMVEKQLKGDTDMWGWDTTGWRHGSRLRAEIQKLTGIEEEFKKDMESKLKSVIHDMEHYKKFYDHYFKCYHNEECYEIMKKTVGLM